MSTKNEYIVQSQKINNIVFLWREYCKTRSDHRNYSNKSTILSQKKRFHLPQEQEKLESISMRKLPCK